MMTRTLNISSYWTIAFFFNSHRSVCSMWKESVNRTEHIILVIVNGVKWIVMNTVLIKIKWRSTKTFVYDSYCHQKVCNRRTIRVPKIYCNCWVTKVMSKLYFFLDKKKNVCICSKSIKNTQLFSTIRRDFSPVPLFLSENKKRLYFWEISIRYKILSLLNKNVTVM